MSNTNVGNDTRAATLGGDVAGTTGTSTATSATSLTDSGASWATNAYVGHVVVCGAVYGIVISNTGTALTIDQWSTPGASDTAGSTPGATSTYVILAGQAPSRYMSLSTDGTAVAASDTTLPSELTTAGGGLIAHRGTYAHTANATSFTLSNTFTANGNDAGSTAVNKVGVGCSIKSTMRKTFQTVITTATLANGDSLTVTDTVSI